MSDVHQVERVIEAIQLFRVNFGLVNNFNLPQLLDQTDVPTEVRSINCIIIQQDVCIGRCAAKLPHPIFINHRTYYYDVAFVV